MRKRRYGKGIFVKGMKERVAEDASEDTSKLATSSEKNGKTSEGGLDNAAYEEDDRTAMNDIPPPTVDNKNGVELVNMNVTSGKTNGSDFTHYYMPVNTHKKLLRGEKLYVTRDPRARGISRRKVLVCAIVWFLIVVVFVLAVLAAMGIIFTSPESSESTNRSTYLTLGTDVPTVVNPDDSTFNGIASPQTMQLEFKITNLQFDNHLHDENSLRFKSLQNRLKNELYYVFLPLHVWKVAIKKFSEGSVIVQSLLYWSSDQPVVVTIQEVSDRFNEALQESNKFLGPYSVQISSVSINEKLKLNSIPVTEVTESPNTPELNVTKETRPSEFGRGMSGDWSTGTQTSTTDLWSILAGWTTEKGITTRDEEKTTSPTEHFHDYETETETETKTQSTLFVDESTLTTTSETWDIVHTMETSTITTERSSEKSTSNIEVCAGTGKCFGNDTHTDMTEEYSTTEITSTNNETTESSVSIDETDSFDNFTANATTDFIIPPFITMKDLTSTMNETNTTTDFTMLDNVTNRTFNETIYNESKLPVLITTTEDNTTITDYIYSNTANETEANYNLTSLLFNSTEFNDNATISTTYSTLIITELDVFLNESATGNNETSTVGYKNQTEKMMTTETEDIDLHNATIDTSIFAVTANDSTSAFEPTFSTETSISNNVTTQVSLFNTSSSESTTNGTQNLLSTERELLELTTVILSTIDVTTSSTTSNNEVDYANKNTIEQEIATKKTNESITESTTMQEINKSTQNVNDEVDYANKSSEEPETTTILQENEVTEAATTQSTTFDLHDDKTAAEVTVMQEETTKMQNSETYSTTPTLTNNTNVTETTTMHNNETAIKTTMMHNNETDMKTTMMHNNETVVTETTTMHYNETVMETTTMRNKETAVEITETTLSDIITPTMEKEKTLSDFKTSTENNNSTPSTTVFDEAAGEVTYSIKISISTS
uniref:SEA domain-containing protein n=1 Tax=Strigamia maritima TaxID=126957 RepID=T1IZA5_STRMM